MVNMPVSSLKKFAALLCLFAFVSPPAAAQPVKFVVLGDMPYDAADVQALHDIGEKIKSRKIPFLIHYGDIKSGGSPCIKEEMEIHFAIVAGIVDGPVFFTPGDNDWTDCDRKKLPVRVSEIEALKNLRATFFSAEAFSRQKSFKSEWNVTHPDPDFPEIALWTYGQLQFTTLHIVGTDNGRDEIKLADRREALDAVDARDRANGEGLDRAFAQATKDRRAGLIVVIHADPYELKHPNHDTRECQTGEVTKSEDARTKCNPYLPFLEQIRQRAKSFGKPVLLVHGSTDDFCVDRNFGTPAALNLWRLNGPGDGVRDAAIVEFTGAASRPFTVERVLKPDSPVPDCKP